jgi:NAD(P)-dependent dehydrogenase (short-subunit alcohol dehydrogenase family)
MPRDAGPLSIINQLSMWTKKDIPDQSGKIVIITGANTGIGYETALALYEAGAHVVLACRDLEKAGNAVTQMRESEGTGQLSIARLDLADLNHVAEFAAHFRSKYSKLDLLINNAGVMLPPATCTPGGFELQFGVNFLGHFALTAHLLPLILATENSRIITVSSGAARQVDHIDFSNLRLEKPYDAQYSYAISKLANLQFAFELDHRLRNSGSSSVSVAVHPGVVYTDLQRFIPGDILETAFAQFSQVSEAWQGALPTLYAATHPDVQGGDFYGPDGENEYSGYPALSSYITTAMTDSLQAERLWEFAEQATGLKIRSTN